MGEWRTEDDKRPVVVTTARGLFAGLLLATKETGSELHVRLADARCGIYWATSKGFVELATDGPNGKTRLGAVASELEVRSVTAVANCSLEAWQKWCR
jgi:hypothetical protein